MHSGLFLLVRAGGVVSETFLIHPSHVAFEATPRLLLLLLLPLSLFTTAAAAVLVSGTNLTSRTSASPLACVAQETDGLRICWRALSLQRKQRLLEGLPEAAAALAGDPGDGATVSSRAGSGSGSGSGNGSGSGSVDLVQSLVLAPVAWCFKVR